MATMEITTMVGCPLVCTFCPQNQLKAAYVESSDRYMSLDSFQVILSKIPKHVRIDFSGMAEPWANPHTTQFLETTLQQGYRIAIYTTLYQMTVADSLYITTELLPKHKNLVDVICLHLPDDAMNMRGFKNSPEYQEVLKNFVEMSKKGLFPFQCMTMDKTGHVHRDLQQSLPALFQFVGHSRAGSLTQIEKVGALLPPKNDFALGCASTPVYDHNVVLPNGDVVLCCMDYSLKHVIGNLLRSEYQDLFTSPEMQRIYQENRKTGFSEQTICRSCENVIKI